LLRAKSNILRRKKQRVEASDYFEATTGCGKTIGNPQALDVAVQLQRGDALAVRDQAAGDVDLARRTARFDAQQR
jgi:hypothetical protein